MIYFYLLSIICPSISIATLYFINKKLHYKSKLIKWLGSRARYQITILTLTFFPALALILFANFYHLNPVIIA